jgi:4-hydroxy-3-polyprenylbenzoate decarboxylase
MFFRKFEAHGKAMPIAMVLGVEPVASLLGSTPLLYGMNEAEAAGGLRQEPVTMVKCETVDLEVPSTAEIVIEGEVLPGRRVDEGPFGEYTGHSAHDEPTPVIKVNCITHRRNPIQTMANMGKPWDDCSVPMSISASAMMSRVLRDHGVPFKAVYARAPLTCAIISAPSIPGLAKRIVSVLSGGWRTGMQYYILVEEDVDVTDLEDVWWAICTRMHPKNGVEVIEGVGANTLIPFVAPEERKVHETYAGVFHAGFPPHWSPEYRKRHCLTVDFKSAWPEEIQKKVLDRWFGDYGFKPEKG